MGIFNFWSRKRLPKTFRFRYISPKFPGVDKELKLKWIEEVDSKEEYSIISLVKKYPVRFVTLPDAFRVFGSEKEADKADLNEDVKKVVKMCLKEFEEWKKRLR